MALMVLVMLAVMVLMDTDTPMLSTMEATITAKDLLSPPLPLNLDTVMVMLTDTDIILVTDTDTPMLIMVTITAKGLLKPSPITVTVMLLMPTMVTATVMLTASKFILLSFLSNYYNGCVYKKFYDLESFDLRSTVSEVQSLAYKNEALVMLSVILCRV